MDIVGGIYRDDDQTKSRSVIKKKSSDRDINGEARFKKNLKNKKQKYRPRCSRRASSDSLSTIHFYKPPRPFFPCMKSEPAE